MRFSIITPVLNDREVLERAIRSVLAQDFPDYEHLVVDGESTDGTLDILRRYPHLDWASEPDLGIYDAMNKALARARGEYIYFLGADDELYSPDTLTEVNRCLQSGDQVVYGDVLFRSSGRRFDGEFDYRKIYHHNICQQAIFYHREIFERFGKFSLDYRLLADWEHNLRWFLNPEVRRSHVDILVARYGDGGLSSVHKDVDFYRVRRYLYLRYASAAVPARFLVRVLSEGLASSLLRGRWSVAAQCFRVGAARLAGRFGPAA